MAVPGWALGALVLVFIIAALFFAVSAVQGWTALVSMAFIFMITVGAFAVIVLRGNR